jgi:hypothetical protein
MGLFHKEFRYPKRLDLQIGNSHVLETLLYLRRADWGWYQSEEREITEEFLNLLQESVIPRMFGTEIEEYHKVKNPGVLPVDEIDGVGGTNRGKKRGLSSANSNAGQGRGKKTGSFSKRKKQDCENDEKNGAEKPLKDVYFSFGDIIQLSYRRQPAPSYKMVLYQNQADKKSSSHFRDLPKLSHRLLIWISRVNQDQKTNPDPNDVGFHRPEMLPISGLFRQPDELV